MQLNKTVSFSELYIYMKCPRKHYLSYVARLHKNESRISTKRMNLGSIIHYFLEKSMKEYWLNDYEPSFADMFDMIDIWSVDYALENRPKPQEIFDGEEFVEVGFDEIQSWDEDYQLAIAIAKRTIKQLDVPNKWRVEEIHWQGEIIPLVEFKFEYPLFSDRNLVGVIDLVARSLEDDQVYLIDWKTRQTLVDNFEIGAEHMSMQLSIYQYVLNSLGVQVAGTITYQIKSSLPTKPALTDKTKKVARVKGSYDHDEFMAFVVANGQDPEEYADMYFPDIEHWFLPVTIIRGRIELQNRWENVKVIAQRMVADELSPKYETPDCCYCPFFKLCYGEDIGLDNQYFIEANYAKGE